MSGNRGGKVLSPLSYPALVVQAVAPHFAFQRLKVVGFEKRDVESHVIVSGTDSDSGPVCGIVPSGYFSWRARRPFGEVEKVRDILGKHGGVELWKRPETSCQS
jgi:hypothetical protein